MFGRYLYTGSGVPAFDPSTVLWSLRAESALLDFNLPLPSSGTGPNISNGSFHAPDTQGTYLNGFKTTRLISAQRDDFRSVKRMDNLMNNGQGYTIVILVKPTNPKPERTVNDGPNIIGASLGYSLAYSTSGFQYAVWDNSFVFHNTSWVPVTADQWHVVEIKHTLTEIMMRIDGGSWNSASCTLPIVYLYLSAQICFGTATGTTTTDVDADYAAVFVAASIVDDSTLNLLRTNYLNTTYGLSFV